MEDHLMDGIQDTDLSAYHLIADHESQDQDSMENIELLPPAPQGHPPEENDLQPLLEPSIWNTILSPYTYKLGGASRVSPSGQIELNIGSSDTLGRADDPFEESACDGEVTGGDDAVFGSAPIGHHGDFYTPEEEEWGGFFDDSDDENAEDLLHEDKFSFRDKRTLFGQIQNKLLPKESDRVTSQDSQEQAKNGFRIADHLTKVPLSTVWHGLTEFWAVSVFLINVIVAMYDIIRSAEYLYYKVTALILGVTENLVVVGLWAVAKHPRFKNSPNYDKNIKYFQYAENILHEVLIYPLLIISIVGFATEKMYQKPGDAFGWTQLILLIIDTVELLITQSLRVFMVYRFMKDLQSVLHPTKKPGLCGQPFAGYVLWRAYFTFVGNLILLLLLGLMLGFQVHKDNYTTSDYHATAKSGMLMVCLIILPIFSLVLFVLTNAYWILEILISLNLSVSNANGFSDQLKVNYGEMVQGALEYAQDKIPASTKRLQTLRETSNVKKALYGIIEIPLLLGIFVYEVFLFLAILPFDGFNQEWQNLTMKLVFTVILIIANCHLIALMVLSNLSVFVLLLSALVYPFTVPFCCRKQNKVVDLELF